MRIVIRIFGALVLLLLLAVGALAGIYFSLRQPIPGLETDTHADSWVDEGAPAKALGEAKARLTQLRREIGYPSVSAAVAVDGTIVWLEAQGFADLVRATRATTDTPFAVGSVSKALTAAVVMRLADRGVIDIDKDVRAYVPFFPRKAHVFSARQLLSHQAGIRHYRLAFAPTLSEFGSNVAYASVRDSLSVFAGDPLLFEPDTSFTYSSHGYTLLSAVVEGAAQRSFLEVMQAELLDPVGMARSGGDDKLQPVTGRAGDYQNLLRDEHVISAPDTNSSSKWAGGGFRATPRDLALFGVAMLDGKVLTPQATAMMFTPRKLKNGEVNPQNYGLGFRIDEIKDPAYPGKTWRAVHHGGVAVGSQAMLVMLPDQRVVVALAANAATQPPGRGMFDAATDLAILFAESRTPSQSAAR